MTVQLIYDEDCAICRASVAWVARRDRAGVVEALPSSRLEAADCAGLPTADTVIVRLPGLDPLVRSEAVASVLAVLPGWPGRCGRLARTGLGWRPLRQVADGIYDVVAQNRRAISLRLARWGLLDSTCSVPVASSDPSGASTDGTN